MQWTTSVREGDQARWLPGHSLEHQMAVTVVKIHARQVTVQTEDGTKHTVSWRTVVKPMEETTNVL